MAEQQTNKPGFGALQNLRMRLLDLTARNRLINFRHTKGRSLRIIDELPDQLVETLLKDIEMRFLPVAEPTRDQLIAAGYITIDDETGQEVCLRQDPTAEEWAKHVGLSPAYEVPKPSSNGRASKHTDSAIQTLLYPYELEARLKNLLQTSQSAIQEMGANILYVAFGFLEWFDNDNDNARNAPLFLVPVRLHKGRLNCKTNTYEYTLSYSGEDIIPNLSLREKLRSDFALALPDLDENTTPESYFHDVESLIRKAMPRWRVRRFVTMALLNFSKLLMYLDLDPLTWPEHANILDHPVVMRFLAGYNSDLDEEEGADGEFGFGEEYAIDEIDDIHLKYPLIEDADSSQHSALIDALVGKNLVIEGPPGTGKSQTITNLIAAAMAQGDRVLFVAEKLAALEVVRRRLDAAGLGEFCLELHSHKSQKRKVLEEISERLNKHGLYRKPSEIDVEIAGYEEAKKSLVEHVERINLPWKKTGRTVHEILMAATRYRASIKINPDALHPAGCNGDDLDANTQRHALDKVRVFRTVYQAIAKQLDGEAVLRDHPWYGVRNCDLQIFDLDRVKAALGEWKQSLRDLTSQRMELAQGLGCETDGIADSLTGMSLLLQDLERLPGLKGDELWEILPVLRGKVLRKTHRQMKDFEEIQELYSNLQEQVGAAVLRDLSLVDGLLRASENLSGVVKPQVALTSLATAIKQLKALAAQLPHIEGHLNRLREAMRGDAARLLVLTRAGLQEFKHLVKLSASLEPPYWNLRDSLFDNEELDDLLPRLQRDIRNLQTLHDSLKDVFDLHNLPSADALDTLRKRLNAGGFFRWLKGTWRSARKQLLVHAACNRTKFSSLIPLLDSLIQYVRRRSKLDENPHYKETLGVHIHGLDTEYLISRVQCRYLVGAGVGRF